MESTLKTLWQRRHLLGTMTMAQLKQIHGRTVLGCCWWLLDPLMMTAVYTLVVGFIRGGGSWNDPYPAFLLCSLVLWKAFSQSVLQSTNVLARSEGLINSFAFPAAVLPMAVVLSTHFLMVVATVPLVFVVLLYQGTTVAGAGPIALGLPILLVPCLLVVVLILSVGGALLSSCFGAFFKDLENIMTHVFQAAFFLSPCLYHMGSVIPGYQGLAQFDVRANLFHTLYALNPMAHVLEGFRACLLFGRLPDGLGLCYALVFGLILTTVGLILFQRYERRFAKEL